MGVLLHLALCLETGDFRYALGGNGPVVVLKEDGSVHPLGTAEEPDVAIRRFEEDFGLA